MRLPSVALRSLLVGSLLAFAVIPAALVGWQMYHAQLSSVHEFSSKIVSDVAQRVQSDTENHLSEAHTIFNGVMYETPGEAQLLRVRQLLKDLSQFEAVAFTLTRMTPNMPYLFVGTAKGEFLGIENISKNSGNLLRVGVRGKGDEGRRFYSAFAPGDRSQPLNTETKNFEPRNRPWYQAALVAKGRVFSPIYPSASKKQLVITLAQPIFGEDATALGVVAVDVYLKRLSELLQLQKISAFGVAYLIDEQGYLVASSTGEALYTEVADKVQRVKPSDGSNATMRASYAALQELVGKTQDESVQRIAGDRTLQGVNGEGLVTALRPFGESLGLKWTLIVAAPQSDFAGETEKSLRDSLVMLAGVIVLGSLLAGLFVYRLNRRFAQLNTAAEQLGRGEVPALQEGSRVKELSTLSRVLHFSGQWLQTSRAEIVSQARALADANEHLEQRVAKRTAQLEDARDAAEAGARAKAAFLATMSHEIRTPLNGVVGMTTLMADTPLNAEQADYLHTMRVSSDQLLGVINDILDFSKIESGKLDLEDEPMNLQAALEEACDIAAPRAREKGLELISDMGDEMPIWVKGDVTRLRQVLINFINNAVKFTERGQVVVHAHLKEDFQAGASKASGALIEFRVQDTGIGIPPDRIGALFQSFSQVDASTTRKYGGTGLGLAICKRLAEIMGGEVGVESEMGVGSSFWFTARLGYADAPDASQTSVVQLTSLAEKQVLVVDDTVLNLRILDKQLSRWSMGVKTFERPADALIWLRSNPVDVIVSDMHMPEMDGLGFVTAARALLGDKMPPVVLLTSGSLPTGEAAAAFDAKFLKPYRQTQLFDAIVRVLSQGVLSRSPVQQKASALKNQTILVADDNAVNLKVAQAMLAKLGYTSVTAVDGRIAADKVRDSLVAGAQRYAAILMDANMPVMDGFASSREIIALHGHNAPPIIALTASVLEEDRKRCLDSGMIGFLAKPLRLDELSHALAQYARDPAKRVQELPLIDPNLIANFDTGNALSAENGLNNSATQTAADTQLADEQLMDWSRLEQFKEFDDEARSMTREVVALFIADAPQRAQDLLQAVGSGDAQLLSRAAHALKGAASNVGASALTEACFVLEHACTQGFPAQAASQVAHISVLEKKTRDVIAKWS